MATGGGKAGAGKKCPTGMVAAIYDAYPSFSARDDFANESICIDFPVFARNAVWSGVGDSLAGFDILWSRRKPPPPIVV